MSGEPQSSRQITWWIAAYGLAALVAIVGGYEIVPKSSSNRIGEFAKVAGILLAAFGTMMNAALALITTRDQQRAQRELEQFKVELPLRLEMVTAFRRALNSGAKAVQSVQVGFDDSVFAKADEDRSLAEIDIPELAEAGQSAWYDYWQPWRNFRDQLKKLPNATGDNCKPLLDRSAKDLETLRQAALKAVDKLRRRTE